MHSLSFELLRSGATPEPTIHSSLCNSDLCSTVLYFREAALDHINVSCRITLIQRFTKITKLTTVDFRQFVNVRVYGLTMKNTFTHNILIEVKWSRSLGEWKSETDSGSCKPSFYHYSHLYCWCTTEFVIPLNKARWSDEKANNRKSDWRHNLNIYYT